MRLRFFNENYLANIDKLYRDFLEDSLNTSEYIASEIIELEQIELFPFYLFISNEAERKSNYLKAFDVIDRVYSDLDREIVLDQRFWHSLFMLNYRDYVIKTYPEVLESKTKFENVLLKKFDWENYIYKCLIAVEFVKDNRDQEQHQKYFKLIVENSDLFNYIIKYNLTRNGKFLLDILDVVDKNDLSEILKKKITHRQDLGLDERYGRRVIFEFNRNYPVLMFPSMSYEEIEGFFLLYLKDYLPEKP